MRPKFERLFYIIILVFVSSAAFSQPFKRLTVDDFQGPPQKGHTADVAFTNCTIEYSYSAKPMKDYYLLTFNIKLTMNADQSWMDRSVLASGSLLAEILKHEQGHYDISYLEQQELLRTVSHTVFHQDYQRVANNIFDRIEAKYHQLNLDYDTDTQNSTNRVQQKSWDDYFAKKLEFMPPEGG